MKQSLQWDNGAEQSGVGRNLARGLGYFSVGLGLFEILAPRTLSRLIGAPKKSLRRVEPIFGVRELVTGLGLLTQRKHRPWLFARVAGDIMDLAVLSSLFFKARRTNQRRLGWAIGAVAGVTALDTAAAFGLDGSRVRAALTGTREVTKSITIRRPPAEVYAFWRDLGNLSRFMAHIVSIEQLDRGRSRWVVRAPAGQTIEWEAEIAEDVPASRIAWRVLPGAPLAHEGVVRFEEAPGNRGTEVHVRLTYEAPLGAVGALMAKLFGEEPSQQIDGDLRRLKQVLETGDVMRSDASMGRGMQPARPQPVHKNDGQPRQTTTATTTTPTPEVRS